jgi:hypothetical protein
MCQMRTINDHKVNPANDRLEITVTDEPGAGGANHVYEVTGFIDTSAPIAGPGKAVIRFQNGPINENGVNGLTQEVLLAIVADRLRSFQAGKFACRENGEALIKIEEAQQWLHARTRGRMVRGVEGTHAA